MFDSLFCYGLHIVMDAQVATLMERCPREGSVNAVPSPAAHSRTPIQGNDPGKEAGATAQNSADLATFCCLADSSNLTGGFKSAQVRPVLHTYSI